MIELFGITLAWETIAFVAAFAASEVIGNSKLKENSVAQLVKSMIDRLKPARTEDEKVAAVTNAAKQLKAAVEALKDK